ncbi:MAG: terpene cyclase/mutase family protein [Lentisphaeraceae bacterium]|nr:terpene cyclase/mutase family protein [Lentisphaeraceae bacterium]
MRRRSDDENSLELLLDTMCNTFGGIVFITILVALITSDTHKIVQKIKEKEQLTFLEVAQNEVVNEELQQNIDELKELDDDLRTLMKLNGSDIRMLKKAELEELKKIVEALSLKVAEFEPVGLNENREQLAYRFGDKKKEALLKYGGLNQGQHAVMRALKWLESVQKPDGSWGENYKYAFTGLAVMSYLAYGIDKDNAEFGETLQKALAWQLAQVKKPRQMLGVSAYEHSIFTLSIAEASALLQTAELKDALEKLMSVIVEGQNEDGGYDYDYNGRTEGKSKASLLTLSSWNTLAIKAAVVAGYRHPNLVTIRTRLKTFFKLRKVGNFFSYTPGLYGNNAIAHWVGAASGRGLGVYSLQILGEENSPEVVDTLRETFDESLEGLKWTSNEPQPLYSWYYLNQALFQAGGENWSKWSPKFQKLLIENQHTSGYWDEPPNARYKKLALLEEQRIFNTTLATMMLTVFYRYSKPEQVVINEVVGGNDTPVKVTQKTNKPSVNGIDYTVLVNQLELTIKQLEAKINEAGATGAIQEYAPPSQAMLSKQALFAVVKNGKLYLLSKIGEGNNFNSEVSSWQILPDAKQYLFNNFKNGLPLSDNAAVNDSLAKLGLQQPLLSRKYYLNFFVYADSFKEFSILKSQLREIAFECNWSPLENGEETVFQLTRVKR